MTSPFDYREMAREYLLEADATNDAERRGVLERIARLFMTAALKLGATESDERASEATLNSC
jgi:hypothetical protein